MVGMKYNRYLIAGITVLTIMLLILFSGAVSETNTRIFSVGDLDMAEYGYGALLLGIGLPLILAAIYFFARMRIGRYLEE